MMVKCIQKFGQGKTTLLKKIEDDEIKEASSIVCN